MEPLRKGVEYDDRITELKEQVDDLERETDRLQNEKRLILEQREEHTELVEYVEQQRKVERYRDRRQRMVDQAGVLARTKWWLTGVPVEDATDDE